MALFDEGHVITGDWGFSRSFDVLQRSARSLGRSFEFSSRRREACRPSCILPFLDSTCERSVRACGHVARSRTPVSLRTLGVGPFGIRQGYRGCSGVLVVIGVGRTDHLNTRHCNHDRAPSLFLTHFLAAVLPAGLTLLARRTVIALPHPPPPRSSFSRPDARGCPGNTSRLLPPVSVLPFVSIVA